MIKPDSSPELHLVEADDEAPQWSRVAGQFPVPHPHFQAEILLPIRSRPEARISAVRRGSAIRPHYARRDRFIPIPPTRSRLELVDAFSIIDSIIETLPVPSGLKITLDVDSTPFLAERAPLEALLGELISNAVAHHDLGHGRVCIQLEASDGFHRFSVADDGPGIMPSLWHEIGALNEGGLIDEDSIGGLALCARLANRHRARIVLDVKPGERGTVARLLWPQFQRVIDA
jgi:signal transduction histidine kinase